MSAAVIIVAGSGALSCTRRAAAGRSSYGRGDFRDTSMTSRRSGVAGRMMRPMTSTSTTLHAASATAVRTTAEAYEAVARVLDQRNPAAALRYIALASSQRQKLALGM